MSHWQREYVRVGKCHQDTNTSATTLHKPNTQDHPKKVFARFMDNTSRVLYVWSHRNPLYTPSELYLSTGHKCTPLSKVVLRWVSWLLFVFQKLAKNRALCTIFAHFFFSSATRSRFFNTKLLILRHRHLLRMDPATQHTHGQSYCSCYAFQCESARSFCFRDEDNIPFLYAVH